VEKVFLTKELREKMIGLLPMSETSTFPFTPSAFMDSEDENFRPVFKLTQLTNGQRVELDTLLMSEVSAMKGPESKTKGTKSKPAPTTAPKEVEQRNKEYTDLLITNIVGWDKLYDLGTGTPFEFDGTVDTFNRIPREIRIEILSKIMGISGYGR
jgi:hypothetical protein